MAVQSGITELASSIYQTIIDEVPDGLARLTAAWNWLSGEGKYKASGIYVNFPVKLVANAAQGFIAGTGAVVNVNPSTQLQYGTLNWKYFNYNANFSLQEMNATKGKTEVVDYIEAKTEGAMQDSNRALSAAIHASSTTDALSFDGLKDVAAASGTSYAGLTDTDYATGAYLPYINTATVVNYQTFNTMLNKLKARMQESGYQPKGIMGLCNESVYSALLNSVQAQQRFYESLTVKTGFEGISINGSELFMDADAPGTQDGSTGDNFLYLFPKKIMRLAYNYGLGNASPFDGAEKLPNQPVWSIQHYMTMNLICNNRRLLAVNKTLVA